MKYLAAGAAVLLTTVFAGITVSAEEEWFTAEPSNVLQEGGLYETSYEYKLPTYEASTAESLEAKLVAAWDVYQESYIDVSEYKLTPTEFNDLYNNILNDHGEMFYVKIYTYTWDGTYVTKCKPTYDFSRTESMAMKAEMNAVVDKILGGIESDWSEAEKALYIHDYLTDNVAYTYTYYDMYELLVNGRGVCQAYALTNDYLLEQVGIQSKIVTSWDLNHAWNLVELGGVWYYTDVTWDDPYPNIPGYSGHTNFLRSRSGLISTGHDTSDWTHRDVNVYDTATGTKYDSYFWNGITSPYKPLNSKFFFTSDFSGSYNDGIYYYDFDTEKTVKFYTYNNEKWPYKTSSGSYSGYWTGVFTGFGIYDGRVLFNTPRTLYSIDVTNIDSADFVPVPEEEYTLPDSCVDYIYNFSCDNNGIVTLDLRDDWYDEKVYQEVNLAQKLKITTQPVNYEGKVGDTATFTVTATGATSYQWQQDTGSGWTNINTTAGKKSSFSIGVTTARANYQYRCVVSNATSSITSNSVKMIVEKEDLAITTQPVNYEGKVGDTATFKVVATGATSYQWQQNTGAGWTNINTTAGRKSSFSIGVTAARAKYQYRCVVSDGTTSLTTNAVKMIVDEDLAITTQPSNYTGKVGDTAKFTVTATGATSYQWQQNTGAGWANINTSVGRSKTFSIGVTTARAKYQYRCVVSDGTNTVTSNAVKMVIDEDLAITTQPSNYTGKVGDTAKFTVNATGATSYQWYQNTGAGWTAINTSVGRSKTFSIGVTAARAKYQYRCVVSDGTTSLTTNVVKMIIDEDLAITSQPSNYIGAIGSTAKFTVGATGATSYQWYQNTGNGWTAINTTAGRSNTFSVAVAEFRLGYLYRCVVSDATNEITSDEVQMYIG